MNYQLSQKNKEDLFAAGLAATASAASAATQAAQDKHHREAELKKAWDKVRIERYQDPATTLEEREQIARDMREESRNNLIVKVGLAILTGGLSLPFV